MSEDAIARRVPLQERIACLTCDFETDYGDRLGEFNILKQERDRIESLASELAAEKLPFTAFVRTDLLERFPETIELLPRLASDLHCHSHTHSTREWRGEEEIPRTFAAFHKAFGRPPLGYRAPQGVLHPGDVGLLKRQGFKFSSSVFPSYRPGKFNHLDKPLSAFVYENGLVELPMAALPGSRVILSLSYLKLLGWHSHRLLQRVCGLPRLIVLDTHLHDFILCEKSYRRLPPALRLAYGRNARLGREYFRRMVAVLRQEGYRFLSMTELYELVAGERR